MKLKIIERERIVCEVENPFRTESDKSYEIRFNKFASKVKIKHIIQLCDDKIYVFYEERKKSK